MCVRLLLFLLSCCGLAAAAGPYTPYEADADTLHLWHLDESGPPFSDSVENGLPLEGLLNGARAGQQGLPGMGGAVSFHANIGGTPGTSDLKGAILIPGKVLDNGGQDNAPEGFRYFGQDGAFTFEMVVKLDVMPRDSPSIALDLLTMEGDGADRIFNFRIEKDGFLVFVPLPHCGASGGAIATIPTSGPHAINTRDWFHVAITYNGSGGVTNNLKLFWTRMGSGATKANYIGSGSLSSDLSGPLGDLAIGNEARQFHQNFEAEPFPGCIDEVRISGIARHPGDFFFVPPAERLKPEEASAASPIEEPRFRLGLTSVFVDSVPMEAPLGPEGKLELGAGLHRLDFDFGFNMETHEEDGISGTLPNAAEMKLRCQLEGIDDQWQETEVGMTLVCQTLDAAGNVLSQSSFPSVGRSDGWKNSPEDSVMTQRVEPIYLPKRADRVKLILSSGSADTTGFYVIDYFGLQTGGEGSPSLLKEGVGVFPYNAYTTSPAGSPEGWQRGGGDPSIARMILRPDKPGIGLVDGDQDKSGEWSTVQPLPPAENRPEISSLTWYEAYNIIGGGSHRATYVNVPPGSYTFRAIGLAGGSKVVNDQLALSIKIHPPFWQKMWFGPSVAAAIVALVAAAIFSSHRSRAKRAMEKLRFQNALEQDRARIARDMHDDLGSRVTFINMSAAMARRDLDAAPENARRHLERMSESTRDLIVAMDGLVWTVDPTHDSLDHLASHLARLSVDMFRDSHVRCRMDIPSLLPPVPIASDVRHHIAMAVKESFNNVLRHAGPCEVFFSLVIEGDELRITIRDTGTGFDPDTGERGHGLDNLASRFREIGGNCNIASSPGVGTCIILSCTPQTLSGKKS